ncbi:MAG: excisionase family DNA-binding protein [Planctomycetota bacterium]
MAIYLKVSKSTLYKLAQEGRVPGHKIGKRHALAFYRSHR